MTEIPELVALKKNNQTILENSLVTKSHYKLDLIHPKTYTKFKI